MNPANEGITHFVRFSEIRPGHLAKQERSTSYLALKTLTWVTYITYNTVMKSIWELYINAYNNYIKFFTAIKNFQVVKLYRY